MIICRKFQGQDIFKESSMKAVIVSTSVNLKD